MRFCFHSLPLPRHHTVLEAWTPTPPSAQLFGHRAPMCPHARQLQFRTCRINPASPWAAAAAGTCCKSKGRFWPHFSGISSLGSSIWSFPRRSRGTGSTEHTQSTPNLRKQKALHSQAARKVRHRGPGTFCNNHSTKKWSLPTAEG